jgi:Asp-tRNA(Asn)/Glu-tRNA(Gln) amidotransferase A subunit family amidase
MARTVEDCAVIFNAISGPDSHDHHLVNQPFVWTGGQDWRQLKIGYLEAAFDEETPHQANDLAVLEVLAHLGATLHPIELPKENYSSLNLMLVAEAAAAFDELTRHNLDDQLEWQDDEAWPNTFRQARFIPAIEYIQASRLRTKLLRQMADLMRQIDVFVAPAFVGNTLLLTNHTGHPAVVLPNGFIERQEHQTPSSITFVGGLFKEAQTLALAKAYQDATTWHLQHPTLKFE